MINVRGIARGHFSYMAQKVSSFFRKNKNRRVAVQISLQSFKHKFLSAF